MDLPPSFWRLAPESRQEAFKASFDTGDAAAGAGLSQDEDDDAAALLSSLAL